MFHPGTTTCNKSVSTSESSKTACVAHRFGHRLRIRGKRSRSLAASHTYPEALQALTAKGARPSCNRSVVEELVLSKDHSAASAHPRKSVTQSQLHATPSLVTELAPTAETCSCNLSASPAVLPQTVHHHVNGYHANGHHSNGHRVNGHVYFSTDTITIDQLPHWKAADTVESRQSSPSHAPLQSHSPYCPSKDIHVQDLPSNLDDEDCVADDSVAARFIPNPSTSGRDESLYPSSHVHSNGRSHRQKVRKNTSHVQNSILTEVYTSDQSRVVLDVHTPLPPSHLHSEHHTNGTSPSTSHLIEQHTHGPPQINEHVLGHSIHQQQQQQASTPLHQQPPHQQAISLHPKRARQMYSVLIPPNIAEVAKTRLEQVLAVDPHAPESMNSFPVLLQLLQSHHIHPWDAPRAVDWLASHGRFCTSGRQPLGLNRACLLAQAFSLTGIRDAQVLQAVEAVTGPLLSQHTIKMVSMLVLAFDKLDYMPSTAWQQSALTALYLMLRPMQPKVLGPVMHALQRWDLQPDEAWLAELLTVSKDKVVKMKPSCCMKLLSAMTSWGAKVDAWWMKMFVHHTKDKLYGLSSRELADIIHLVVLHNGAVPDKWYRCFQKYALVQLRNWEGRDCVRVLAAMSCIHQPVRIKLLVDLLQRAADDCHQLSPEERIQASHAALALGVKTQHFNKMADVRSTLVTHLHQLGPSSCAYALVLVDELNYKMPPRWFEAYLSHTAGQLRHMSAHELAVVANRLVKAKVQCSVEWRRLFVRHLSTHVGEMAPQEVCTAVAAMGSFIGRDEQEEIAKFSSAVVLSVHAYSPSVAAQVVRVLSSKGLQDAPAWVVSLVQQVKAAFVEQHGSNSRAGRVKWSM